MEKCLITAELVGHYVNSTPVLLRDVPGPVFALSSWCFSVLGDVASAARRVMDFLKGDET